MVKADKAHAYSLGGLAANDLQSPSLHGSYSLTFVKAPHFCSPFARSGAADANIKKRFNNRECSCLNHS
jgi:hypothetical protein